MAKAPKTLSDIIRAIKVGTTKTIKGYASNTVRATAGRVLGAGNYAVEKVGDEEDQVCKVKRY